MKYRYWLASIKNIGNAQKHQMLSCQCEEALYWLSDTQIRQLPGIGLKTADELIKSRLSWNLEAEYQNLQKTGVSLVSYRQEIFPSRLRHVYDPPCFLYYKGSLPESEKKAVAVVGARMCTEYGRITAQKIGQSLGAAGIVLISGMALGVDAAAQWGAIRGAVKTYAVLGCGADICYPADNRKLYQSLLVNGGILSEYPIGTTPKPYYFPRRNRIISALSDAVIVVEARKRSGSLITADFALEQGKDVYAVPGRVFDSLSEGTNRLIAQGAGIFISTEEFLKDMKYNVQKTTSQKNIIDFALEKNQQLVYSVLDLTPKNLERLLSDTGLGIPAVTEALAGLLKFGMIEEVYQNYYIKII